jgi:Ni,Fe-hydrogenase III large subunit/Ni,Fe-hydrogenase III component G
VTAMETGSIARLLAGHVPAGSHVPWPRFDVDAQLWSAIAKALGEGEADLLGLWGDAGQVHAGQVHMALRAPGAGPCVISLAVAEESFPSVGRFHPPAIRLERAVCDLYGYAPAGAPDSRAWLDHGRWERSAPLGANVPAPRLDPAGYEFQAVHGHGLHQIPVGPVHAGIIEPGHFRFTANGETVARLEERLGYVHKGIDGLLTGTDLAKAGRVVARVSGDSTVALSFAFARAVEAALGVEAPPRAAVLRGVMAELERIANHLGDIGAICNDAAFALILAHCGIFRERVLAASDRAFGHRLMMDRIVPGGVAQDIAEDGIAADGAAAIVAALDDIAPRFEEIVTLYDDTPSLQDRTCATGYTAPDLVKQWAAGGFVGRASGRGFDARRDLAYPPYDGRAFPVPIYTAGDVDARVRVRIDEVRASMKMIRNWLGNLAEGPVSVPLPPVSGLREGVAVTEAFRGDVLVWLRLDVGGQAGNQVARCHVRDASWFQWPLLEAAIKGNIVADFPLCNKSFNCSYSGHDL